MAIFILLAGNFFYVILGIFGQESWEFVKRRTEALIHI